MKIKKNKRNDWQNPIYISYARADDKKDDNKSIEDFVTYLIRELENCKYVVRYDKNSNPDTIIDFEKEFKTAKFVIVVLSDKYFHSQHCMNEWMKIHSQKNRKYKPIYVVYDGANKYDKIEFQVNVDELKKYWFSEASNVWEKIKNNETLTKIEKISNVYHFYYYEINKIRCKFKNLIYFNTSDKDKALNDILKKVREYVNKEYAYDQMRFYANDIVCNDSMLIIGDSILRYKINKKESISLHEYISNQLLDKINITKDLCGDNEKWYNLREWNRNYWTAHCREKGQKELLFKHIKAVEESIEDEKVDKELLIELLDCNYIFKPIITTGCHVKKIIENYYEKKRKNVRVVDVINLGSFCPNDRLDNDNRKNIETSIDVYIYDISKRNNNENDIIFSESDIVNIVIDFTYCFNNNKVNKMFKYNDLVALGTDFPGWALRFMWAAFPNSLKTCIVNNKIIDEKSYNFMLKNKIKMNSNFLSAIDFVKKFKQLCSDYLSSDPISGDDVVNIYVYFFKADFHDFMTFKKNHLMKIQKEFHQIFPYKRLNFLWRNNDFVDGKSKISKSSLFILYKISNEDKIKDFDRGVGSFVQRGQKEELVEIKNKSFFTITEIQPKLITIDPYKQLIIGDNHCLYNDVSINHKIINFLKNSLKL